jgi:hypothetical protein
MGLAAWRKNDPLRAVGMTSFLTVAIFTVFPWTIFSLQIFQQLHLIQEFRSFAWINSLEFGIGIMGLAVLVGFVIVAVWQTVCGPVYLFSEQWATPLWGQRRVVGTPKIRVLRYHDPNIR